MEFPNICVGCMEAYTYGDFVYLKKMNDLLNGNNNNFILNQIQDMYITSPLKFMDKIFESFPNLFFDRMIKI